MNGTKKIIGVLLTLSAFVGAGWALDSRIQVALDRMAVTLNTNSEKVGSLSVDVARLEERIKTLEKALDKQSDAMYNRRR